jgi:hypothetical protein
MRDIACSDCVVTSLLDSAPIQAGVEKRTEVSEEAIEAISLLSSRGIVRPMRFSEAIHG